ncbi:MAG: hypothetical protein JO351_04260 [Candidatus Eremiobacteraeota bacterium]|nr:hypothetical protein [Candidatus Eremiobacteraeota bacterium]MBV9055840.1 hypothetical protein [Candidatus Eremiobacteraeota bacterium]
MRVTASSLSFAFALLACAGCTLAGGGSNLTSGGASREVLPQGNNPRPKTPASQYISHVIVIIQENRSFENFFAGYPGADAPMYGYGKVSGKKIQIPLHKDTFEVEPNLPHEMEDSLTEWDGGKMDLFNKFGKKGTNAAYAYIDHAQLKPYYRLAKNYVLAAHMFPTEFGPSWTGHMTLIAGTDTIQTTPSPGPDSLADFSDGAYNSCDSPTGTKTTLVFTNHLIEHAVGPFPCFTQFATMASTLDAAGVSWKYYVTKVRHAGIWSPFEAIKSVRYGKDWQTKLIAPQTKILTDPSQNALASVSWVTPSKPDSDHPGQRSDLGPSWVASVVNAIGKSPYWNSSAIIVVWDDWGGFYDNEAPPQLDYRGLGMRVPCLIISPYAKKGYVSPTQYEFGSILKFMEEVFGLPPLGPTSDGYTDTRANSIMDSFSFAQKPRRFEPIPSKYPISHFVHEPPSDDPVDEY